ncbi:peroxidase P7 isoform X1 [Cryptomeria japonica]|uniref:peroxidase P7 isoform X1 n=1 Tax=Cryptomeria japonica TaxID=3369 RepID=UPI0025ACDD01|nr:peroxidase P7 isoform X1 [Cryptomeria japonica]
MAASLATLVVIVTLCLASANAQLTSTFYDTSCPNALSLIKSGIKKALASEPRLGASILRLHFHDCFAQGCDGSILLDGSSSEKNAGPNTHSARGFDIIDSIKTQVEAACSGVVSCADILTVAARDSVVELGGPAWTVPLGRRDSKTSNLNAANTNIPSPTSSLGNLTSLFQAQGLSTKDMVALSGAHTIGQARCTVFRNRIYNDANIDSSYAKSVQAKCPSGKTGNRNLSPLDVVSPTVFDNNYYKNLRKKQGLLHSDQELFNGGSTDSLVTTYSTSQSTFFNDFAAAMVNMGNINPLTGSSGEIRKNCRKAN